MNLYLQISKDLDVFTCYEQDDAIKIPSEIWFQSVCASLRMKHSVLIMKRSLVDFPVWDESKRWQATDNWCWLSPRSLSVISAANKDLVFSFDTFLSFLASSK